MGFVPTLTEMAWPVAECSGISAGGRRCCSTTMPVQPRGALVSSSESLDAGENRLLVVLSTRTCSAARESALAVGSAVVHPSDPIKKYKVLMVA